MKHEGGMKEGGDGWREKSGLQGLMQAVKSTWKGGRAMRVTARGNKKEIPGNFVPLYWCSRPPTKMLLLYERMARKATCPGALLVSKLVKLSRAELDTWTCSQIIPRQSSGGRMAQTWFQPVIQPPWFGGWGFMSRESDHAVSAGLMPRKVPGHIYITAAETSCETKAFFCILYYILHCIYMPLPPLIRLWKDKQTF